MSIPCGFDGAGLPIGLQLIGNYFAEARMLNIAHQYQLVTDWHLRTPPGVDSLPIAHHPSRNDIR
jgi:aspartyl-tRNA(Asn)/glutamyl-tRNA(Gln) amidotransferase subunit A